MEEWRRLIYRGEDLGDFYLVSSYGNIKSVKTGGLRSFAVHTKGYLLCAISLGSRDKKMTLRVHKAVAESFIPNPDNKPEVNHIDGNKGNNAITNLEWADHDENEEHAVELGLREPAKLSDEQVAWAYSVYEEGSLLYGLRALAQQLGVHHTTLRRRMLMYQMRTFPSFGSALVDKFSRDAM